MSSWNKEIILKRLTNARNYTENASHAFRDIDVKTLKILPNPSENVCYSGKHDRAGEVAPGIRTLAPLPDDLGLIPYTYMWLKAIGNSSLRGSDILFWPLWSLHKCGAQSCIHIKNK